MNGQGFYNGAGLINSKGDTHREMGSFSFEDVVIRALSNLCGRKKKEKYLCGRVEKHLLIWTDLRSFLTSLFRKL